MEKTHTGDQKETQTAPYSKTELEKAIRIVNTEATKIYKQIEQFYKDKERSKVVIKGYTTSDHKATVTADGSELSEILLNYSYIIKYILKSELPRNALLDIMELVDINNMYYVDLPFSTNLDDAGYLSEMPLE